MCLNRMPIRYGFYNGMKDIQHGVNRRHTRYGFYNGTKDIRYSVNEV